MSDAAKARKSVETRDLWAPIIKPARGMEWICWTCVRSTRRNAKEAFLKGVLTKCHKEHLARARFARVYVAEY